MHLTLLTFIGALALGVGSGCSRVAHPPSATDSSSKLTVSTSVSRVGASPQAVDDLETAFKRAVAAVGPTVVSVYSTRTVEIGPPWLGNGFLAPDDQELEQQGLGSGFIVSADGLVVTNNHVVEQADEIKVKLADGREVDAKVVGVDPPTDLALLRIDPKGARLPVAQLGRSSSMEVGDWVLAIGNPFGLPRTVSAGIVSAVGRANVGILDFEDFIQTDAAVNLGNSGGPLVDLDGRVIGINTAIASTSGGSIGIAFAVPIDMARDVIRQLAENGKVVRGHLGVSISGMDEELARSFGYPSTDGILVQDVTEGGAASRAGLRPGDIIQSVDGKPVSTVATFRSAVAARTPGSAVEMTVWREGASRTITAKLGEAPGSEVQARAARPGGPRIGLGLTDVTPELRRQLALEDDAKVVVSEVLPGSPAAKAGLRPGDVLESIDDAPVVRADDAVKVLQGADADKGVRLRVVRDGVGRFVILSPPRAR
jgi:serine protease Do